MRERARIRRPRAARADDGTRAARPARAPRGERRPRVRLETDARRAQLLALGMRLFAERTYDEISMDDLAREAGVSKGLVFHYFRTKRDFYVEGLRHTAGELLERTTTIAADLPPLERVRRGLDAYLDYVHHHARSFVALLRGGIGSDPEVAAVIEATRSAYVDRFLDDVGGSPLAAFARTHKLIRTALRGWLGAVEAASLDWLAHGDVDRARIRDMLVDVLIAALRSVGAPGVPA